MAMFDDPGRLQQPRAVRVGLYRRGREVPSADHDSSRAYGVRSNVFSAFSSNITPALSRLGWPLCKRWCCTITDKQHEFAAKSSPNSRDRASESKRISAMRKSDLRSAKRKRQDSLHAGGRGEGSAERHSSPSEDEAGPIYGTMSIDGAARSSAYAKQSSITRNAQPHSQTR